MKKKILIGIIAISTLVLTGCTSAGTVKRNIEREADDLADFLEEEHIEYEGATDIFIGLQQQCKKQKEVIIKVMNLIKKYGKYDGEKWGKEKIKTINKHFYHEWEKIK